MTISMLISIIVNICVISWISKVAHLAPVSIADSWFIVICEEAKKSRDRPEPCVRPLFWDYSSIQAETWNFSAAVPQLDSSQCKNNGEYLFNLYDILRHKY